MKTLYLVRHAQAIPRESGGNDFKRMLAPEGREDAIIMGNRLARKGFAPDLLLASPADRTLETAHIFAEKLNYPIRRILVQEELYPGEDETCLSQVLNELPDVYQTVMLFGHEPALSRWTNKLLPDFNAELRATGVIGLTLAISAWQEFSGEHGALKFFDFPMQTPPKIYKDARTVMQKLLTMMMEDLLEQLEVDISKQIRKTIKTGSKHVARELVNMLQISKVEELALGQNPSRGALFFEDDAETEKEERDG